jgi:hypothetical protein
LKIPHGGHYFPITLGALCTDGDIPDWRLELDQRMSLIVEVDRRSLTTRTEIGVMAYSTFVADSSDIGLPRLVFAKRPIAVDTRVSNRSSFLNRNTIIDGHEAVVWMNIGSAGDTS